MAPVDHQSGVCTEEEAVPPSATAAVTSTEEKPAVTKGVQKPAKKAGKKVQLGIDEMLVQRKFISPSAKVR